MRLAFVVSFLALGVRRLRSFTTVFVLTTRTTLIWRLLCLATLPTAAKRIRTGTLPPVPPVTFSRTVAFVRVTRVTFRPVTFNVTLGFEPVGVWLDPGLDGVVGLEPVLVELLAPLDGPCWPVIGKVTWSERRMPSSTNNACTFTVVGLELNTSTAARPFESVIGHTRRRPSFSASEFRPL